jgi:hypothetical protein
MKLDALQDKLVTLLATAFPNELVVADYGRKATEAEMEASLATRGVCFSVSPMLTGKQNNGAGGRSASIRAYVKVVLRTNAEVNGSATGANLEPIATLRTAITAVLAYAETGNRKFALSEDEDCIEHVPDSKDAGLLCWQLTFTYTVQV